MESFSLRNSARKVVNEYSNNAKWKSIAINFEMDDSIKMIYGNKFSIEALLSNLFFNAIKYTPEKGKISINIKDLKKSVLIEITDTGIGIDEAEQSKIFDEFYRTQNAKKHDSDGTGMGLAITSQIIKTHNGQIWLESKINEGTTFWVKLPKKP